jgi:hypothetical protein
VDVASSCWSAEVRGTRFKESAKSNAVGGGISRAQREYWRIRLLSCEAMSVSGKINCLVLVYRPVLVGGEQRRWRGGGEEAGCQGGPYTVGLLGGPSIGARVARPFLTKSILEYLPSRVIRPDRCPLSYERLHEVKAAPGKLKPAQGPRLVLAIQLTTRTNRAYLALATGEHSCAPRACWA